MTHRSASPNPHSGVVPAPAVHSAPSADSAEPQGVHPPGSGTPSGLPGARPAGDLTATVEAGLAALAGRPPADHPEIYARLHTMLTDALAATVDQGR